MHERDPGQARELFDRTARGIGTDHRTRLEDLIRGGRVISEFPTDSLPGQPMDEKRPSIRTMDLRPEDRLNDANVRRDKLYRPEDGEHAVQLRDAEAGEQAPSAPNAVPDVLKSPDDLMLEPGAKYRDPGEWGGKLGETANDIGGAAADVAKSAWINATGSPQEVKDNLSDLSKEYRAKGYAKAADNLDHFLNGKGAAKTIPRDEARKDPFIQDAESKNRKRFETGTFLGKTKKEQLNRKIRSLKDGETVELNDHWDVEKGKGGLAADAIKRGKAGMDDILADGERNFKSIANFTATRKGDKIHISGTTNHDGTEIYDFETDGLGHLMGAKGLAEAGLGHNFKIDRKWDQTFEGTVEVVRTPNGVELTNPRFKWYDTQPSQTKP